MLLLSMMSPTGILTIDLTAIQSNWQFVASSLKIGADCAAVIKANAYGVGAIKVASALFEVGCRHFYVVTLDEAIELRNVIPQTCSIYVLGGARVGTEDMFEQLNLTPVLYSYPAVQQWVAYCESIKKPLSCILKIDTGMTRLGLSKSEFADLLKANSFFNFFKPVMVMSHLACADESNHFLNHHQLTEFQAALDQIRSIFPEIKASLANSSGSFLGDDFHFDMVRIGAALYGINPQVDRPNPLKQVISLKLPVQQIRLIEESAHVGYGAAANVVAGSRLAVVAGGYADGIHRTLGFRPVGLVGNVEVAVVGRISMDSCVFDITRCPIEKPEYIEVINRQITLDVLMKNNHGLGYEVLTSLGKRFKRHYLLEKNDDRL